jgi:pimeloyl-ACP methyl ester carboxylesterase
LREISELDVDDDTGILAIELLSISMRMTSPVLSRPDTCLSISRILASLNIDRFVLAAHSYGTVIAVHMLHSPDLSPRIAAALLIDPIPFLLHLPNVAYNFVYRQPRSANEWQLWFFASRDPDVSHSLSRHFFWAQNVMWKEELEGRPIGVSLSGCDQIVDAEGVRRHLTEEDEIKKRWEKGALQVLFYPDLDHAMVFDKHDWRLPLVNILHKFVRLDQDTRLVLQNLSLR